ncbi:putative baseplate assembly protein [Stenotrophomonas sp.]|uniref:putative baseplate assembly protein n=1 Tax=Stenotrophomonas sp. TaxID=69392 RepID=UPI0028AEDED6|nr:putative baseplate assembly protein [Stenotrophomonas sp.]
MSTHDCHCGGADCGCCSGVATMTPMEISPRPALPALPCRVGTHGRFLASMKARLPGMEVIAPGDDGQTMVSHRPLQALTTRDPADPALALLDAWACVGDVLTFYQERIANEGYLRTAVQRRSLVELARLVGYQPRAGVSASVHLSYNVDTQQAEAVDVPLGTRAQSIPGPDELPQMFETDEPLQARREWNDLGIRRQRPQWIDADALPALNLLYVAGVDSQAQAGDLLLFEFAEGAMRYQARRVLAVVTDFEAQRTTLQLQPLGARVPQALPLLQQLVRELQRLQDNDQGDVRGLRNATRLRDGLYLGVEAWPLVEWAEQLLTGVQGKARDAITGFGDALKALDVPANGAVVSTPDDAVAALLMPPQVQAANRLRLRRDLGDAFAPGADLQPQLITGFAPRLKDAYYDAWRGSNAGAKPSALQAVYLLGAGQALFGATSAHPVPASDDHGLPSLQSWPDWRYAADETASNAFLPSADPLLASGALILVSRAGEDFDDPPRLDVLRVSRTRNGPRSAYGLSGDTLRVDFGDGDGPTEWREVEGGKESRALITELRGTWLYPQRRVLQLADAPILDEVFGDTLELALLHEQLASGRWVVVEGERSDLAGVRGVNAAELMMVAGLRHGQDPDLPGDRPHTTLQLATPLAYRYYRASVVVRGNVVAASHGETRREVLGSSDARRPLQRFELRQPPLTWRPAPTALGATSTLKVYVNDVAWPEAPSLALLGPDDRAFVTTTDGDGGTAVVFGDGEHGLRPPSGVENLRAEYRNGIGKGGNVRPGQVALMVTRPLGLKDVVNPLRASGGADRETDALIRENAPRSIIALDRLVSVPDYADFTRMFAGIAKAEARRLSDLAGDVVQVSYAGVEDMPIDIDSDLYRNLAQALRTLGDPGLPVRLVWRERIALVLQARLRLLPGYRWEPVTTAVRARLLARFGFDARALAQPALLCEVIAAMQSVAGIDFVDVESFGGITDTEIDPQSGQPRLVSQVQITAQVERILHGDSAGKSLSAGATLQRPPPRVEARPGRIEQGVARPAQIACFMPSVADTLILNPDS